MCTRSKKVIECEESQDGPTMRSYAHEMYVSCQSKYICAYVRDMLTVQNVSNYICHFDFTRLLYKNKIPKKIRLREDYLLRRV